MFIHYDITKLLSISVFALFFIIHSTTLAAYVDIPGARIKIDLEAFNELNYQAQQIIPLGDCVSNQKPQSLTENDFEKCLDKKLDEKGVKEKINNLKSEISQFLVSGGLLYDSYYNGRKRDSEFSDKLDLTALNPTTPIHPLLIVLTRSILFKAFEHFVSNTFSITAMKVQRTILNVIPVVNLIYAAYVIKSDNTESKRIREQNDRYYEFQECAVATLLDKAQNYDETCGTPASQELVPSFRRFSLGAAFLNILTNIQISKNEPTFSKIDIGDGTLKDQMEDYWDQGIRKSGLEIHPGAGFVYRSWQLAEAPTLSKSRLLEYVQ